MTAINTQAQCIAKWHGRAAFGTELNSLGDRDLDDIGLDRRHYRFEASKPFWMA